MLVLPLVQLAIDPRWIFGGPGRDPWIYYGYFRFARIYLPRFADHYFSSRLSVILPGYLAHHLLPSLAANVALHLVMCWLAAGCFYVVARSFAGRRAALLATMILGSQPYFLVAIGWDYVDGFGITYFLFGSACLAMAARSARWRPWWIFAAGAAAAAIITANLFYSIYLPLLAAYLPALDAWGRQPGARRRPLRLLFLADLPCAAAGAVSLLAGMAAVGHFWGHGPWWFLGATLRFLIDYSTHPNIFKHPAARWLRHANWLVFPTVVLACGTAVLIRAWRESWRAPTGHPRNQLALFVQLQYLGFFLLMALEELLPQGVTFEYVFYSSLLLPPACIALAGQLHLLIEGMSARSFVRLAAVSALSLAVAGATLRSLALRHEQWPAAALALLATGIACLLIASSGRRGLRPALLFMVLLAASQLAVQICRYTVSEVKLVDYSGSGFFLQVDRTVTALRQVDPALRLRLWYDMSEDRSRFYDTVASTLLLCGNLVTRTFPDPEGGRMCDGEPLRPGLTIAVLSQRPDAAALALAALARVGLGAHLLQRTVIPGPAPPFVIIFLETRRAWPANAETR